MWARNVADRLAVCSWSLHPATPEELIDKMNEIGLAKIQLHLDPLRENPAWKDAASKLADAGMSFVGGMITSVGEDYSSLDAIRRTGGIVPDETWPRTWANTQATLPIARSLRLNYITFHAGFLPEHPGDPAFGEMLKRVRQVADAWASVGVAVGMETGQEDADTLLQFLAAVDRPNVGINFDPANMILYDKDEPIDALVKLAPYVKQTHVKDAIRTRTPGQWGTEVEVGKGEVYWEGFFRELSQAGYNGYFAIEREAGDQRVADICTAKDFVIDLNS
jgi:sugar phosphate isomerase/epimerase